VVVHERRMVAVSQKLHLKVDLTVARGCSRTPLITKSTLINLILGQAYYTKNDRYAFENVLKGW
jgi:hypothetical protein